MNNQQWKCKRCGEIVDMVNFRCGCAVSPSPWEPVVFGDTTNTFEEELCPNCNCPIHPCMPCEEVVMLNGNHTDDTYKDLLKHILKDGRRKKNRTGVDTIGVFGAQAKYDVCMDAFPILTTKKVWFKGIVHELLWFIKGDTNIKYLVDNGVHIWDEWAYQRFCKYVKETKDLGADAEILKGITTQDQYIQRIKDSGTFAVRYGNLGEGTYGGMWRGFPYCQSEGNLGIQSAVPYWEERVDQLQKVIQKLKNNPDDRRIIVSAWHPYWVDHCALPPCHCLFHFNTEELTLEERCDLGERMLWIRHKPERPDDKLVDFKNTQDLDQMGIPKRRLNCLLYQRSCDTFLGVPFNITSYALLTAMIAHCVGMEPGVFTHTYGDLHLYVNHLDQVNEQLERTPKALPKLWLNPKVTKLFDFKFEDVKLIGYDPHPAIKGDIAV